MVERSGAIRDVGRTLNVGSVLVGSVRKAGDRIRVTAQLIDATTGLDRWSQVYDERALADVFDIQTDIARRIAHLTAGQPWPAEARPGVAAFTHSDAHPPPPLDLDPGYRAEILATKPWGYWRFQQMTEGRIANEIVGRPALKALGGVQLGGDVGGNRCAGTA